MIIEYQRPQTISEALELLGRSEPRSYALGGGTFLNRASNDKYAVVDLQALGLGGIKITGNQAEAGATVKLQELLKFNGLPQALSQAIHLEATYNLRHMATIAGTLVTAGGRSAFATILLALDASLEIQEQRVESRKVKLGDWLPLRRQYPPGRLITHITFPVNVKAAFETIARTPADQPIVCAALAQWKSGRTRLALGGWGDAPTLAMDGPEAGDVESAAKSIYSQAGDQWASAEYRQEMAGVLSSRCFQKLAEQ